MEQPNRARFRRARGAIARLARSLGALPMAPLILMVHPALDSAVPALPAGWGGAAFAQMPVGDPSQEYGLTIARVKNPIPPDIADKLAAAEPFESRREIIQSLSLMLSELSPKGAKYQCLKEIALLKGKC